MKIRHILVPYDFSDYSERAWQVAVELAGSVQAELHLIHVIDGPRDEGVRRRAMEKLLALVLPSQETALPIHRDVRFGSIDQEIVEYARSGQIDWLVMGTRGRSGIRELALGSVAHRVLRHAPCPVTMVGSEFKQAAVSLDTSDTRYLEVKVSDAPAVDLVARAVGMRATDIHIDPLGVEEYQVRLRIDGKIIPYCVLDRSIGEHLMHQFSTLARIDVAEPFRPREGRLHLPSSLKDIEVRLTWAPVAGGEAMALRLFSKENVFLPLDQLGFSQRALDSVRAILCGNEGLVLVTGPTGSGKTTTVYSMLETFGGQHRNIVSIEDPVEFSVPFVRQLNVDERHGVTMTSGLRTVLRMDPDILFVGEIRDPENAEIALRAASSGRFVFSSLHTRDVASTITALRDLDVSNHSIAANLMAVINQRLVRALCPKCRRAVAPDSDCRQAFEENRLSVPSSIFEAVGCEHCRGTGFFGRSGVFETARCDGEVADAIVNNATESEIRRTIRGQSQSLTAEALQKVGEGITSYHEARSVRWL